MACPGQRIWKNKASARKRNLKGVAYEFRQGISKILALHMAIPKNEYFRFSRFSILQVPKLLNKDLKFWRFRIFKRHKNRFGRSGTGIVYYPAFLSSIVLSTYFTRRKQPNKKKDQKNQIFASH